MKSTGADPALDAGALKPCPFCGKAMMLRGALWPSEGDRDGIIHAEPTDCPLGDFSNDTFDGSIVEVWNDRAAAIPGHAADEGEAVAWTQPGCLTVVAAGGAMLAARSLTDGGREALNVEEAK